MEMLWKCLLVASACLFPRSSQSCCNYPPFAYEQWIIHEAAGRARVQCHWTHLDLRTQPFECQDLGQNFKRLILYCNSSSACPTHTLGRKCRARTSFTYRSVIMYLQGLSDLSYNDSLWVFLTLVPKKDVKMLLLLEESHWSQETA